MALGPNNVLSISNGARNGVRCAILAAFGRLLAFAAMISIAGLGLGALLLASETLFTLIKFAGAAYLIWIGIKLFRSTSTMLSRTSGDSTGDRSSHQLRWLAKQEFLVAVGNPKAILVFTAFFPQFVDRTAYATSFLILGATFLLLELVAIAVYAVIGSRIGVLTNGARGFCWFNRVSGSVMIGFGLLLGFLRRPAA